jgi:pimeloyl-ACP methyl ester carboxylesterase
VARAVPSARQVILPECGHVPQVELADRTNALIRRHIPRSAAARSLRAA